MGRSLARGRDSPGTRSLALAALPSLGGVAACLGGLSLMNYDPALKFCGGHGCCPGPSWVSAGGERGRAAVPSPGRCRAQPLLSELLLRPQSPELLPPAGLRLINSTGDVFKAVDGKTPSLWGFKFFLRGSRQCKLLLLPGTSCVVWEGCQRGAGQQQGVARGPGVPRGAQRGSGGSRRAHW